MSTAELTRRLSAIFSADVEGYSRLMRDDEENTVQTITTYRKAMTHIIQQYRGRVVDSPGDNILAEFSSVVDGVNCAVEIQRELAERNAELPETRQMRFRIGLNLGDILEEGERIYGDGVNIAARMESLADAGGICISGTVYDAVESKIGLEYEFLGEHEVKNIDKPIRAYRILSYPGAAAHRVVKAKRAAVGKWQKIITAAIVFFVLGTAGAVWYFHFNPSRIEVAAVENMKLPLPEKPSIAVLPFDNMSGDTGQDYFCDGLTEQIITSLSKHPGLFVIARNSTFFYKGKSVTVKKVAEELGVQYILEGSIQRSENRLRITAQLIDALKGVHIWAETYNENISEIFALQDKITINILREIGFQLQGEVTGSPNLKTRESLEAAEKAMRATLHLREFNRESNAYAKRLYAEAVELDPGYSDAYAAYAVAHIMDVWLGSSDSPADSLKTAYGLCQKALDLDEYNHTAYNTMGHILLFKRKYDDAIAAGKRAVDLCPNCADTYVWLAMSCNCAGMADESIRLIQTALRLSPHPPNYYYLHLAVAYRMTEQYDKAYEILRIALARQPENMLLRISMTVVCGLLGREEEARLNAEELLKINPDFSVSRFEKTITIPYKNRRVVETLVENLRKAGLK
jgi:adenylate cyclase